MLFHQLAVRRTIEEHRDAGPERGVRQQLCRGLREHRPEDPPCPCAERQPDADLPPPLGDGERHHRVDAGGRQEEHAERHGHEDAGQQAHGSVVLPQKVVHRRDVPHLQRRVHVGSHVPQSSAPGLRVSGVQVQRHRQRMRTFRGGGPVDLRLRSGGSRRRRREVFDDADDLVSPSTTSRSIACWR